MFYHRLNPRFFHSFRSSRAVTWLPRQKEREKGKGKSRWGRKLKPVVPWYQSRTSFVRFTSNDLGHRFLFQFHSCKLYIKKQQERDTMHVHYTRKNKRERYALVPRRASTCFFFPATDTTNTHYSTPFLVKPSWRPSEKCATTFLK